MRPNTVSPTRAISNVLRMNLMLHQGTNVEATGDKSRRLGHVFRTEEKWVKYSGLTRTNLAVR